MINAVAKNKQNMLPIFLKISMQMIGSTHIKTFI